MRSDHFYVWTQSNNNQWYNCAIWASSRCFGFVKKKKSSGQTFFLTSQSGDAKASSASMIPLASYIWRVPETCGLKLIPPELLEDLVINPCPVSTSQSSFITIPVCCGSSCLGRVFFSSGRNTLHFVHWSALHIWSTSLRCAHTNLHCPMSATQCNTFLWHTVSRQQVIFGEVGVMFGTRALCGHLGIWAVSSIQQYSVLSSIPSCFYSKVIVPLEIICTC